MAETKAATQPIAEEEEEFTDADLAAAAASEEEVSEEELLAAAQAAPDEPPAPAVAPPATKPQAADPGFLPTVGRNLLSGFFKQGSDEAAGAIAGAFTNLGPNARYKNPDGTTRPLNGRGDVYRAVRDTERETLRGATENRPWTSLASSLVGDVASDAALSAFGVPVATTGYQTAIGALGGLLGSDAELSTDNVRGGDVLSAAASTGLGAGLGYALPKVGAAVSEKLTPAIAARMRKWLEDSAISQGRRVLLNGADTMKGNKELPAEAVREALESGVLPAFSTTQEVFKKLEDLAAFRGENYGEILRRLQAAGVQGPNVEAMASALKSKADDIYSNSGSNKSVAELFKAESENIRAVAPLAPSSAGDTPLAAAENLQLNQAERIKRDLQSQARYDRLRLTGLDEAKQEIAASYRKAIEDSIAEAGERAPAGSEVAELASEFLPTKQQLARTIAARDAAERGTAAAAKRRGISLTDYLSAGAAVSAGPAGQLLAAAGNNFMRNRGTSAFAAGAFGASKLMGQVNAQNAQRFGNELGAALGRQARLGSNEGQQEAPGSEEYRQYVMSNPQNFGAYGQRLADAAAKGQEAFALEDYMLAQSTPEYADMRRRALMEANGETP